MKRDRAFCQLVELPDIYNLFQLFLNEFVLHRPAPYLTVILHERNEIMKNTHRIYLILMMVILFNLGENIDLAQCKDKARLGKAYTIVSISDFSMKALTRKLSDYNASDLRSLPVNIRKEYRIVVPSDISKEGLKEAMKNLVLRETKKNPDIDEIVVFAYDRKEDARSVYTYGKLEWCPHGIWGSVTPGIALTNNRSTYKYIYEIKNKIGQLSDTTAPTRYEFSVFDSFEKALEADPNTDEEIIKQKVASELGIPVEEIDRICIKVLTYKFQ